VAAAGPAAEDDGVLGVNDLWTYVLGTIAIVLLPGPNSLFVLATAARFGVRAGYRAAAGVFIGDWVLMAAAALGVASLLRAFPPLFLVIKYAGAGYLAYIGITMAIKAVRRLIRPAPSTNDTPVAPGATTPGRPFNRALMISLLNPKAILFVISFFVQFLDPGYAYPALSFLLLAVILQVFSLLYLTGLIFGGTYLAGVLRRRRRLATGLTTAVGALFVGFGIRLATASI
jgi:leucine efflux protein